MTRAVAAMLLLAGMTGLVRAQTGGASSPPQTPVFGVGVDNVFVDAFVSRGGAPLMSLVADDFELRDNGVLQQIELVAADTQPFLAVFVFDTSNSLEGDKLSSLRAASDALLDTLRADDQATLFAFADQVEWLARPATDKRAVKQALSRLRPGGGTTMIDALFAAITLPQPSGTSLVVLLTDGVDNMSWLSWSQIQPVAEKSNVIIHVVALPAETLIESPPASEAAKKGRLSERTLKTEFPNEWALRRLAEATGGDYWKLESLDRLRAAFTDIADAMGKRYVLRYSPENVSRKGWHKIELRLRGKRGDVRTRSGYWVTEK